MRKQASLVVMFVCFFTLLGTKAQAVNNKQVSSAIEARLEANYKNELRKARIDRGKLKKKLVEYIKQRIAVRSLTNNQFKALVKSLLQFVVNKLTSDPDSIQQVLSGVAIEYYVHEHFSQWLIRQTPGPVVQAQPSQSFERALPVDCPGAVAIPPGSLQAVCTAPPPPLHIPSPPFCPLPPHLANPPVMMEVPNIHVPPPLHRMVVIPPPVNGQAYRQPQQPLPVSLPDQNQVEENKAALEATKKELERREKALESKEAEINKKAKALDQEKSKTLSQQQQLDAQSRELAQREQQVAEQLENQAYVNLSRQQVVESEQEKRKKAEQEKEKLEQRYRKEQADRDIKVRRLVERIQDNQAREDELDKAFKDIEEEKRRLESERRAFEKASKEQQQRLTEVSKEAEKNTKALKKSKIKIERIEEERKKIVEQSVAEKEKAVELLRKQRRGKTYYKKKLAQTIKRQNEERTEVTIKQIQVVTVSDEQGLVKEKATEQLVNSGETTSLRVWSLISVVRQRISWGKPDDDVNWPLKPDISSIGPGLRKIESAEKKNDKEKFNPPKKYASTGRMKQTLGYFFVGFAASIVGGSIISPAHWYRYFYDSLYPVDKKLKSIFTSTLDEGPDDDICGSIGSRIIMTVCLSRQSAASQRLLRTVDEIKEALLITHYQKLSSQDSEYELLMSNNDLKESDVFIMSGLNRFTSLDDTIQEYWLQNLVELSEHFPNSKNNLTYKLMMLVVLAKNCGDLSYPFLNVCFTNTIEEVVQSGFGAVLKRLTAFPDHEIKLDFYDRLKTRNVFPGWKVGLNDTLYPRYFALKRENKKTIPVSSLFSNPVVQNKRNGYERDNEIDPHQFSSFMAVYSVAMENNKNRFALLPSSLEQFWANRWISTQKQGISLIHYRLQKWQDGAREFAPAGKYVFGRQTTWERDSRLIQDINSVYVFTDLASITDYQYFAERAFYYCGFGTQEEANLFRYACLFRVASSYKLLLLFPDQPRMRTLEELPKNKRPRWPGQGRYAIRLPSLLRQ